MSSVGVRTYLDADLAGQVARIARAQARSESSVIAEAVRLRLAAGAEGVRAAAAETQTRRLQRIEAALDKIAREQALVRESLFVFVRVWLEHNPPLEDEIAASLAAGAAARFERFLDLAAAGLPRRRSIGAGIFAEAWTQEAGSSPPAMEAGP